MNTRFNFIVFITLLVSVVAFSQTDSLKKTDSINGKILKEYKLQQISNSKELKLDSIKKSILEEELLSLKTTDNLKKQNLLQQLEELKNAETNRLAIKRKQIESLKVSAKGYPVIGTFSDTLFLLYNRLGSFSAQDRAEAVSNRLRVLEGDYNFDPKSLKIINSETNTDIVTGEKILFSVSENDAIWNDATPEELAETYRQIIVANFEKHKEATSFPTLMKEIGLALLVILLFSALIYFTGKLFTWTASKIELNEEKSIKEIKLKDYTLFDAKRQVNALLLVNKIVKWFIVLLLIYIALPILFGIFPWTKNFAEVLFGYILNPLRKITSGIWNYLPNLITIIVIVIFFRYVMKGIHFLKEEIKNENLKFPGFYPDWANPTFQIVRVLVYAFMVVVIFPYLPGSDSPIFKGVSVFLGFLFTFGSAGSLANVIAGLVLTYMRLFKIGDRVKIGDVFGDVIEKSLLVTRVRTAHNEIISIPNSTVMSSHTINYSSETVDSGLILHTTVTIGYDVPWQKVHNALLEAANRTEFLLKEPKPFVFQNSLEDFYVGYEINAYTKNANQQGSIYSDLHTHIQDCFNEAGIEIMSPHYRAGRDGSQTTIPESYLPKDYKAPPFNFNITKP
ncbi:mechanosensitive ion channel domain-containing protein [Flavobacterium antarcticum]|uniref:mechanosensitive ion channel domain-containing protein n=1 Tax=Flavobacterium antarcticum TaxID=271155 RepID=UPI0003B79925|nr:mechanosensitive ion channel domain-containing protein [Flavobacterium antarcticum]